MANDIPTLVETLRSRIVSDSWIGEFPSFKVIYLKFNVKVLVGLNILAWGRVGNDGRDHFAKGGDVAHSY